MTRVVMLIVAGLMLLAPAAAEAHTVDPGAEPSIGLEHMRLHAKIWKAQAKARKRWHRMTPAQRRAERRRIRRFERRSYLRAHASVDEPADQVGSWEPPFNMTENYQGYAIHAAMLHTGKVLMWGYPTHPQQTAWRGNVTYAWLWDPSKGYGLDAVKPVPPTDKDGNIVSIYCSGMSFLPDGRVLVVGGNLVWPEQDPNDAYTQFPGLNRAMIFDPTTETWTELPRPEGAHGRWYPSQVLLPDGKTFVLAGLSDVAPGGIPNDDLEIYDANSNSFTLYSGDTQRRRTELYPHLFTMPNGKVLLAGPNPGDSAWFDPGNLDSPWTDLPPVASQRIGGNGVLLPDGPDGSNRVALIGGRPYDAVPPAFNEQIDLSSATPSWTTFPGSITPRSYPNTVLLPDRTMVTVGGDSRVIEQDASGNDIWPPPERDVELYDPVTNTWKQGPPQVETRAYHSTALLLPDGRVLSTGDDLNPTPDGSRALSSPNDTGEIYSPPYLFKGPRPTISSAPEAVRWDVPFGIGTADAVDEAVLIAPAAVTHANDMNQRFVPLRTVSTTAGGISVQSPPSPNVAPPGWYMLFLVNDGVPSIASWVRLDGAAADVAAIPPDPAPEPQPDVTGPRLKLRFDQRGWLGRLRHHGKLRVHVTVDERATVNFRLLRGSRRVARARVEMKQAGTRAVDLKPSRSTLRWLRRARAPKLRFSAVAIDAAKNDTAWTRLLKPSLRR